MMRRVLPFLVLLLTPGFALAAALPVQKTVTLSADVWCPYNCDPKSPRPGFMVEIAQRAFAKENVQVRYVLRPWSQAIDDARGGRIAGIIGASVRDARDFIFPAVAQGRMVNKFFVRKGTRWRFDGVKSLEARTLAAVADYSYDGGVLDLYLAQHQSTPARVVLASGDTPLADNVKKLLDGKVDVVVEDARVMGYYAMTQHLVDQIEEAGELPLSKNSDLFVAFSPADPNAPRYAARLAETMQELRRSGELQKILAVYGVKDWE